MKRLQLVVFLLSALASGISGSVTGNCDYSIMHEEYTCTFSVHIFSNEDDVTAIEGTHLPGYTDNDVVRLQKASTLMLLPYMPTILFSGCSSLQTIDLGSNELTQVPANVFVNSQLRQLYLDNNQISDIAVGAFSNLINLQELFLGSNQLTALNADLFKELSNLSVLYVFNNLIVELPEDIFKENQNLNDIDMYSNQLTRIHPSFLDSPLSGTRTLWFSDNICINSDHQFNENTIDEVRPFFEECFQNYVDYNKRSNS